MLKLAGLSRLNQRGDTIVEVLISIAVVSLILGGAYVTTNHSLQGTRAAQERSEALKVVESQLEKIKAAAVGNPDNLFGAATTGTFCIAANGGIVGAGNASCRVNGEGNPTGSQPAYNISITRNNNTFVVTNTWDNVRGSQDKIQMTYRVYDNE